MNIKKIKSFYPALLTLSAVLLGLYFFIAKTAMVEENVVKDFHTILHKLHDERDELISTTFDIVESTDLENVFVLLDEKMKDRNQQLGVLVFHQNKIVYWTDNDIPFPVNLTDSIAQKGIQRIKNGWYDIAALSNQDYTVVGFVHLLKSFNRENQYLENGFVGSLSFSGVSGIEILKNETTSRSVFDVEGSYLFDLIFEQETGAHSSSIIPVILLLFVFIFGLKLIENYAIVPEKKNRSLFAALFILVIILIRWFMVISKSPDLFYATDLFDPAHYAFSSIFSSTGDLLLNALSALYIIYFFNSYLYQPEWFQRLKKGTVAWIVYIMLHLILAYFGYSLNTLIIGSVENSTINFDVSDIFHLNYLSYVGLAALGIFCFVYLMIMDKVLDLFGQFKPGVGFHFTIYSAINLLALLVLTWNDWNLQEVLIYLWSLPLFFALLWFKREDRRVYSFSKLILLVLLFALSTAVVVVHSSFKRELGEREHLAAKLSTNFDPVAEYLFNEIHEEMLQDSLLKSYCGNYWMREEQIRKHLEENYFSGYWNKYDFQFVGCTLEDTILITSQGLSDHCFTYFDVKIAEITEPTAYEGLFHEESKDGIASYIGQIDFQDLRDPTRLYIEFRSKPLIKSEGYPELLLGQKEIDRNLDIQNYSFARYYQGDLMNSAGEYNYPMHISTDTIEGEEYFNQEGFSHFMLKSNEGMAVILSHSDNQVLQVVIVFSFLFSLFLLLFLIFSLLIDEFPVQLNFSIVSFGSKLQLLLIVVTLFVAIPFGVGVAYYIQGHYEQRNDKNITEKISSVLTEVEHKIGNEEYLPEDMPEELESYLNQILIKFSNVFYTDINLYGLNGNLLATSRAEVFDIGLKGKQMHPDAFKAMDISQKSLFIHNEKIGSLSYLSAYVPFRNNENELLAYLNLPYFAKQNELERDLSSFLLALVNIYIFLIALAIIVSVVFADYLSRPLKLISSKIRGLKLGGENELIQWDGDDEIGVLVKEYNRMVKALAKNVEKLTQSEREGAWREMAKQVAHEIKNPLTPMKLSVQHLKRASDDNAENIEMQIDKVSKTLIEQIDSLTRIANEFSSFAKMPAARNEQINLVEVVNSSKNLYSDQSVAILFNEIEEEIYVNADRDQFLRVFNNIIKNAIQSIVDGTEGLVEISIVPNHDVVKVLIKDNGKGISEEEKRNIFVPNFTTKSGGMGLGLAMVKNIVEQAKGRVYFESVVGEGTTFIVELPRIST